MPPKVWPQLGGLSGQVSSTIALAVFHPFSFLETSLGITVTEDWLDLLGELLNLAKSQKEAKFGSVSTQSRAGTLRWNQIKWTRLGCERVWKKNFLLADSGLTAGLAWATGKYR